MTIEPRTLEPIRGRDPHERRGHDAVVRALAGLDHVMEQRLGGVQGTKTADCDAGLGQIIPLDPRAGGFEVRLPKCSREHVGQTVVLKNVTTSTNAVKIWPADGDTIDSGTSYTINTSGGWVILTQFSDTMWARFD